METLSYLYGVSSLVLLFVLISAVFFWVDRPRVQQNEVNDLTKNFGQVINSDDTLSLHEGVLVLNTNKYENKLSLNLYGANLLQPTTLGELSGEQKNLYCQQHDLAGTWNSSGTTACKSYLEGTNKDDPYESITLYIK